MSEKEYTIKLTFKYSDTVKVKASSKDQAIHEASLIAEEVFECAYDAEVLNIEGVE